MTREHKLSLILGFAVVLIVGVLMSDHLSGARQAQLDQIDPSSGLVLDEPTGRAGASPSLVLVDPEGRPVEIARPENRAAQTELAMAAPAPGVFDDATMFRPVDQPTSEPGRMAWLKEQIAGTMNDLAEGNGPSPAAAVDSTPTLQMTAAPAAQPESAGVRLYTVRSGDTLWGIAEKTLGDGFRHKELASLNRDRIGAGGELRVGASLRLPGDATLPATTSAASKRKEAEPAGKAFRTYTVQRGDTLGEISQKLLGSSRRQRELLDSNRDQLDDPNSLRAGMVLKIPAR